jgi:16S rRNA processing protein RimM
MIRVGKIVATHGINGSLILSHLVGNSKWLKKKHILLVEMQKGSYIPYFITQFKPNNEKEYIIELEDIDKVEVAKKLITKQVYVDESILSDLAAHSPLLWIGFSLKDSNLGTIGTIEDVIYSGNQWLAKVIYQNKEALVPLIEQFINKVNIKVKQVEVTLPDGLLEVYL